MGVEPQAGAWRVVAGQNHGEHQMVAWRLDLDTGAITWAPQLWFGEDLTPDGPFTLEQLRDLVSPQDWDASHKRMVQCSVSGSHLRSRLLVGPDRGADSVFVDLSGDLVVDEEGRSVAIVGVAMIAAPNERFTDAAATQQQIIEDEQLGRVGTWTLHLITDAVHLSEEMYQMLGLKPSTVLRRRDRWPIHPEDRPRIDQILTDAITTGRPVHGAYRVLRNDGMTRRLRIWARPTRDDTGQIDRLVGVCEDVTELEGERAARIAAERRFQRIFSEAPLGIGVFSKGPGSSGVLIEANHVLGEILGLPLSQLTGRHYDDLGSFPGTFDALLAQLASERAVEIPVTPLPSVPGGARRFVRGRASCVTDAAGDDYVIAQAYDVTSMVETEMGLRGLADHDDLTGLWNRRRFRREVADLMAAHQRNAVGPAGSVLIIDVDRFKWVNDSLGHAAGDAFLTRLADALKVGAPPEASVARLAGDEFGVLLPGHDEAQAWAEAERLRQALYGAAIHGVDGKRHRTTVTIGVATIEHGAGVDQVLVDADVAMYQGKQRGRNRVEILQSHATSKQMLQRVSLAERVREALDGDHFEIWQQPIVDLDSRAVVKRELLLRLVDEDGEVELAARFMPAAEDFGLATAIDAWVLEHVVPLALAHQEVEPHVLLAINLSGQSIGDPALIQRIDQFLIAAGVDPRHVVFEITETAGIGDIDAASTFTNALRDRGFGIAIDDFGVGFGSFTYLQRLPFQYVKIDQSFVENLITDVENRLLVQAAVLIAHGLGRVTIAEGVEDAGTATALAALGVNLGQGHYFGAPEPFVIARSPMRR